ncbi:MAG: radical SAM protein [bacterium]|nr:radical SAM protein [bacterium]
MKQNQKEKILLAMLPFWDPQIPPLGISCLKGFLQNRGYTVKAVDANTEEDFRQFYHRYFGILKKHLPQSQQGNLSNFGNIILENNLMAHINYTEKTQYIELIRIIIADYFLFTFEDGQVRELISLLDEFFLELEQYVLKLLEQEQPTILGLSVFSGTLPASMRAAELARAKFPHIKTVFGGGAFSDQLAAGTPDLDYFIRKTGDYIDHVIIGEGETLFLKLIRDQLPQSQKVFTFADQTIDTADIQGENVPDFSDFALDFYPHLGGYGSRGCPYQCKFCSETVNWGKYRKKQTKQVVEELGRASRKHNYQLFLLSDSLLNPVLSELSTEMANAPERIYFDGFLRADKPVCDTENTLLWRRGGYYRARLGLESGSDRILEKMGKKIDSRQIKKVLYSLAYAGIKTTTYWVIGFPGETEEDFLHTLHLLSEMKDNIYEAECNAFLLLSSARVLSEDEENRRKKVPIFPQWARPLLLNQTCRLDGIEPPRTETMKRVQRFVRHCKEIGIPNPYSLEDVNNADERWKRLHKNAVPPLMAFRDGKSRIDDVHMVKTLSTATSSITDDDDWL